MAQKNYYDKDAERQKRNDKNKKTSFGKVVLWIIAFVVIALATFVITIKTAKPNFDFSTLVPQSMVEAVKNPQSFIDEKIWGVTTEKTTEAKTTIKVTTTAPQTTTTQVVDYLADTDFKFNTSVQGSQVGTLLNGGLVGTDMSYTYYYVKGKGIYRFVPSTEDYALYYGVKNNISCMNLRGDYIYYVNNKDNGLYKLQKGTSKPDKIADDVEFAYVYDSTIYYITDTGDVCTMNVKKHKPITVYNGGGDEVTFVGISLNRVFFTAKDLTGAVHYLTVDKKGKTQACKFREDTDENEIAKMQLENGFFYYYQNQGNGEYNLVRQKYGSDNIVTLIKNASTSNYPEIDLNRMYYSVLDNGVYRMKELNMNSGSKKTMLSVKNVDKDNSLAFYLGGEYQFIIGEKSEDSKMMYKASSIYTSSTNAMQLTNGKWRY